MSILSVSDLNEYVRRTLAADPMLRGISVRGEISNFKRHISGHLYFSLKDENSRIACVMFRQYAQALAFTPTDGQRVVMSGSVGLYTASGSYQFYAERLSEDGVGDLYKRFLILKDRLEKEGLFDASQKRPLPLLPKGVGVVTSRTGAVLHDIRTVMGRRFPGMNLILRPALVQGEGAAEDIAEGIRRIAALDSVDVIIVGRGGGSAEDLWAFNEEVLVRAIARCAKPVISAVGHETDVTLADFAADVRAATPSAAAELAVPERDEMERTIRGLRTSLRQAVELDLARRTASLGDLQRRLRNCHPGLRYSAAGRRIALARQGAAIACERAVMGARTPLDRLSGRLRGVSPQRTLRRGYVIALGADGPVTGIGRIPDTLALWFQDGKATVRTISVEAGGPFDDRTDEQQL